MDNSAANGDPDRLGISFGNFSVASLLAPEARGFFFALPEAIGPFGVGGVGTAMVKLTALANTNPFASAVSATTGRRLGAERQRQLALHAAQPRPRPDRNHYGYVHPERP